MCDHIWDRIDGETYRCRRCELEKYEPSGEFRRCAEGNREVKRRDLR